MGVFFIRLFSYRTVIIITKPYSIFLQINDEDLYFKIKTFIFLCANIKFFTALKISKIMRRFISLNTIFIFPVNTKTL